MKNQNL